MNNARRDAEWLAANRPQPQAPAHDVVRNPAHYTSGREFEPIDVIEDWELPFHLGNALKYIARAGRKDPKLIRQDISKAIWYLERFNDQFVESEAQAKDADDLLRDKFNEAMDKVDADNGYIPFDATLDMIDQEEIEFEALGEKAAINGIPSSILPGPDDVIYLGDYQVKKDLSQFEDYEIVTTHLVDGSILGTQKNGDVIVLGSTDLYDEIKKADPADLAPSEFEPPQPDPWEYTIDFDR